MTSEADLRGLPLRGLAEFIGRLFDDFRELPGGLPLLPFLFEPGLGPLFLPGLGPRFAPTGGEIREGDF